MPIEPIIGFVLCGLLLALTRLYLRYFHREATPHPEFERWIASRPLVAAMRAHEGRSVDVLYRVRQQLGRGEFYNAAGGYPWQHYVVAFECRRISDDVVGLFAVHAKLGRERDRRPSFQAFLEGLGHALHDDVDEVWLHGRVRSPGVGHVANREKMSWSGAFDDSGALEITAMIGHPTWLTPEPRAA